MYTEEPNRNIDWGSVLKKGLLILIIALVIFLIIWLFVRNNNSTNVSYSDNDNNNNGLITDTDFYSKNFIDNFRYFHDDAKEYFLVSELPKEGETIKYTLQQLIDKNIILSFGYEGKSCDTEASYVTVTNTNGKYHMTTTLVCGTEVAKTTVELGCNQLCVSGKCKVEVVEPEDLTNEYRFKQAYQDTESVYACPTGYTKSGSGKNTICLKGDETTVSATKVVSYNCPTGYTKNVDGDKVTCTKDTSTTTKAVEKETYTCPSGYTSLASDNKVCTKQSTELTNPNKNYTYSCPSGYLPDTNDKTKCVKSSNESKNASLSYTYTCPSGTTYQTGSGSSLKCYKGTTINATATCSQGTLSNGKCVISGTTTQLTPTKTSSYGCPSGYSVYSGSGSSLTCYRKTSSGYYNYYSYPHNTTYQGCTYSGTVLQSCGSNCTKRVYAYYCGATYSYKNGVVTSTSYSCPSGTDYKTGSGSSLKCYKYATPERTVNPTYSCSKGTLSGTSCVIKDGTLLTTTKSSSYSCDAGYTLSGSKCYKTTQSSVAATQNTNYSCNDGYELNANNKCVKKTEDKKDATKNVTYSCPDGFKANGSGKDMTCVSTGKDTKNAVKNVEYKCEAGYTKFGLGSQAKCTKGKTTSVAPTVTSNSVTKYRYKWSTEESIPGWERTGEVRQTKASLTK